MKPTLWYVLAAFILGVLANILLLSLSPMTVQLVCSIDGAEVFRSQEGPWRRAANGDWILYGPGDDVYYRPFPGSHCLTVRSERAQ